MFIHLGLFAFAADRILTAARCVGFYLTTLYNEDAWMYAAEASKSWEGSNKVFLSLQL